MLPLPVRWNLELLDGFGQGPGQRRPVALIGASNGHGHDRAGVEIHRVLGFAGQMRPSFILVIRASGSDGEVQSVLDLFFLRFRSRRATTIIPRYSEKPVELAILRRIANPLHRPKWCGFG